MLNKMSMKKLYSSSCLFSVFIVKDKILDCATFGHQQILLNNPERVLILMEGVQDYSGVISGGHDGGNYWFINLCPDDYSL